jgi:hypothetical protein
MTLVDTAPENDDIDTQQPCDEGMDETRPRWKLAERLLKSWRKILEITEKDSAAQTVRMTSMNG